MAATSRTTVRLSTALWAERRLPSIARLLRPSPVLPGEDGPLGTVYRGGDGGPLLVLTGDAGAEPRWLGSALASVLGAVAVVVPADGPAAPGAPNGLDPAGVKLTPRLRDVLEAARALGADPERVAVVGVGDGAAEALAGVARIPAAQAPIRRLVLLAPTAVPEGEFAGVPPTFLQSSPRSATLGVSRSLEIDLREAGVAVRPVEYADLPDAWVRYPRFTRGSKRAVDDILAFLRRGFGMDGTFSGVIPGWDLR